MRIPGKSLAWDGDGPFLSTAGLGKDSLCETSLIASRAPGGPREVREVTTPLPAAALSPLRTLPLPSRAGTFLWSQGSRESAAVPPLGLSRRPQLCPRDGHREEGITRGGPGAAAQEVSLSPMPPELKVPAARGHCSHRAVILSAPRIRERQEPPLPLIPPPLKV